MFNDIFGKGLISLIEDKTPRYGENTGNKKR